jgi:plasmid stability protein
MHTDAAKMQQVRTTLTIDDEVYRQIKSLAAVTGRSVGSVVEEALRVALARAQQGPAPVRPLPVSAGAPLSGVDLDDSAALLDTMGSA